MDHRRGRKELVFVVRMWAERDESGCFAWRGRVELARTQASRYFTDVGDLCEFIRARQREEEDVETTP